MANKNYQAGRRFEYERRNAWIAYGYEVVRASGSHGSFDLICLQSNQVPVLIQCKRVSTMAEAKRLMASFESHPPLQPSIKYVQIMEVKVKGKGEILSTEF